MWEFNEVKEGWPNRFFRKDDHWRFIDAGLLTLRGYLHM